MNWLIIGSTAASHWYPDWPRTPLDIDVLTPAKITGNDSKLCVVDTSWHDAAQSMIDASTNKVFADPDILYTLKLSHAHWDIKWGKTMFDLEFLKNKGCSINFELYQKLFKVWSEVHGPKRVNLNKPMTEFFKDSVQRKYDHEELHFKVAFYDRPMHERLRPNHGTAWCSEEQFKMLSEEDQIRTALEEMMVVAIERKKLTAESKNSEVLMAMSYSYKQLCTSMTTGWFARFLILNRTNLLFNWREQWKTKIKTVVQAL